MKQTLIKYLAWLMPSPNESLGGLGLATRIWVQFLKTVPPTQEGAALAHQVLILKRHLVVCRAMAASGHVDYRT